jgi:TrmH family RNA methyltransferase
VLPAIASRRHPVVQRFRALAARRRREDPILLDGAHLIGEALAAGLQIEIVLAARGAHGELTARAARAGAAVHEVSGDVLEAASPVRTPSGIVAIAAWRAASLDQVLELPGPVIGLVDVQDPGNLGSVIRSADALEAAGVLALGDSADPGGWKALRGAMGSTFRVRVSRATFAEAAEAARRAGRRVIATVAGAGVPLEAVDLDAPALILLGNEGTGLSRDVVAAADERLTVPMRESVNSLNVATTSALVLWEARRRLIARVERA